MDLTMAGVFENSSWGSITIIILPHSGITVSGYCSSSMFGSTPDGLCERILPCEYSVNTNRVI